MREELGLPEVPNSPKPIFRLAHEDSHLSPNLERWIEYAEARIDTSHDYDEDKADSCLDLTSDFIQDAIQLHRTMTGEEWEWGPTSRFRASTTEQS